MFKIINKIGKILKLVGHDNQLSFTGILVYFSIGLLVVDQSYPNVAVLLLSMINYSHKRYEEYRYEKQNINVDITKDLKSLQNQINNINLKLR